MTDPERIDVRSYLEALWVERDKRLDERWRAQQTALEKATTALERRLDLLNELREGVLSRDEYDGKHEALLGQMARLREDVDRIRSEALTKNGHVPYEERLSRLENWRANVTGRAVAVGLLGAIFVAVVTGFIVHLINP
jgi:hypothetical protein